MTFLALIAMMCGPMSPKQSTVQEVIEGSAVRTCYKDFIMCVERKQAQTRISDEKALRACILEK